MSYSFRSSALFIGSGVPSAKAGLEGDGALSGEPFVIVMAQGGLDGGGSLGGFVDAPTVELVADDALGGEAMVVVFAEGGFTGEGSLGGRLGVLIDAEGGFAGEDSLLGKTVIAGPEAPEGALPGTYDARGRPLPLFGYYATPVVVTGALGLRLLITDYRGRVWEFTRPQRQRLTWSSVVPGGDEACSWTTPCDADVLRNGMPEQRSRVEVRSDQLGRILWVGWLKKPFFNVDRGRLVGGVEFQAEGYYHSAMVDEFEYALTYGPARTAATSRHRVVISAIEEAMEHARTQKCPFITASRLATFPVAGIMEEDTESFAGGTAANVWSTMQAYLHFISNPLWWQVYDIEGAVTLEFFSHPGTPDYFDRGTTKYRIGYDAEAVRSRATVEYSVDKHYTASAAPVFKNGVTQSKYLNVVQEARSLDLVRNLGDSLVQKFNRVRITEGDIEVKKDIWGTGNRVIYVPELRAGRMIRLDFPEEIYPYLGEDLYIARASFDEDSCTAQLSPNLFSDSEKNIRMLPFVNTKALSWGIVIPEFNPAHRDSGKVTGVGPAGSGIYDSSSPRSGFVQVTGVLTDAEHDFGPGGGVVDPVNLPKNVVNINATIGPQPGDEPDDGGIVRLGNKPGANGIHRDAERQEVQHCIVEHLSVKAREGETGTIRVDIDKFVRETQQTIPNFLTISLTATAALGYAEKEYDSRDVVLTANIDKRKIIESGDYLIYHITVGAGSTFTQITVGIQGRKRWPYIPEIQSNVNPNAQAPTQPDYVKRPGNPTYPHDMR